VEVGEEVDVGGIPHLQIDHGTEGERGGGDIAAALIQEVATRLDFGGPAPVGVEAVATEVVGGLGGDTLAGAVTGTIESVGGDGGADLVWPFLYLTAAGGGGDNDGFITTATSGEGCSKEERKRELPESLV
jgi:hypothetical protein